MMVGIGFAELLLLLLTTSGQMTNDLVSLIPTEDYCQHHKIELDSTTMMKLADTEPSTPEKQIQQLLAIRWLGEHFTNVKEPKQVKALLQQIAAGKKVNDAHGFAKLYAKRALAHIEKKPLPVPQIPKGETINSTLNWFLPSVDLAVGLDFRSRQPLQPMKKSPLREMTKRMTRFIGPGDKREIYQAINAMGNIQIDHVSLGIEWDQQELAQGSIEPHRLMIRVRGSWNTNWLKTLYTQFLGNHKIETRKEKDGQSILLTRIPNGAPGIAVIGNHEAIFAGYWSITKKHLEVVEEILAIRAGKNKNGYQRGDLAKVTDKASKEAHLLIAAKSYPQMQQMVQGLPFLPKNVLVTGTQEKGLTLQVQAQFKDEVEATAVKQALTQLKDMGLKQLKAAPKNIVPEQVQKTLVNQLNETKIFADGATANVKATIDPEAIITMVRAWFDLLGSIK